MQSSHQFLNQFKKDFFEKKPAKFLTNDSPFHAISESDILRALIKCGDLLLKKSPLPIYIRLYINGLPQSLDPKNRAYFPIKTDSSIAGYVKRVETLLNGDEFFISVSDFFYLDEICFVKIAELAKSFNFAMGPTRQRIDAQIFLGNYSKTPQGVHEDPISVFHVPLYGKKSMRFWHNDYVKKNVDLKDSVKYDKHMPSSDFYTAEMGQVLYWPSSHWHIAESQGQFSMTWSFGYWTEDFAQNLIRDHIQKIVSTSVENFKKNKNITFEEFYTPYEIATEYLHESLSAGDFSFELKNSAAKIFSAHGLWNTPKFFLRNIPAGKKFIYNELFPILAVKQKNRKNLILFTAGNSYLIENTAETKKLIQMILKKKVFSPKKIFDSEKKFSKKTQMKNLLNFIYSSMVLSECL